MGVSDSLPLHRRLKRQTPGPVHARSVGPPTRGLSHEYERPTLHRPMQRALAVAPVMPRSCASGATSPPSAPTATTACCVPTEHCRSQAAHLAVPDGRMESAALNWRPRPDSAFRSRTGNSRKGGAGPPGDDHIARNIEDRARTKIGRSATQRVRSSSLTPLSAWNATNGPGGRGLYFA